MVSALDSGSKGPRSSPGRVIVLCSWERHLTLTVPLSTQEYKWIPAYFRGNLTKYCVCVGGGGGRGGEGSCMRWFMNRDKLRRCGPLGSCADFTYLTINNLFLPEYVYYDYQSGKEEYDYYLL